ncbi:hypothetical protein SAMN02787118_115134 [Streptomyces mirabilis]|uniref:Autotransporter-associated beta strand repeat-containing protein n=1 Tax=Streptomyces mirabilis TaxID=68239 RepID=A0A1I2NUZ3_9ACTN|nr:hypothetical protein SAMN02787118_115134 [Streptomyces mirabilis]
MCYGKVNGSRVTKMDARFLLSPPSAYVSDDVRSHTHRTAAAVGALATVAFLVTAPPSFGSVRAAASAVGGRDATADVLADRDVTLTGDTVVTVPSGTTTYDGVFRGQGTLTVRGGGTLILTKDGDFTLPAARQRQKVTTQGGNHPYTTVSNPDPPAITVERGATLQYGTGGGIGLIGHFPYNTPGYQLNQLNVRVDGTLRLSLTRTFNIGTISGSGLVTQPRNMWGTLDLAGTHPFSGVIDNGTGMAVGRPEYPVALPNARAILNQGSWIIDTPLARGRGAVMPHGCQLRASPDSYTWASRRQKFQCRGSSDASQAPPMPLPRVSTFRTTERSPTVTRHTPPVTPFVRLWTRGSRTARSTGAPRISRTSARRISSPSASS